MKAISKLATFPAGILIGLTLLIVSCTAAIESDGRPGTQDPVASGVTDGSTADPYDDLRIVTVLPRDAISAIDAPQFIPLEEADKSYDDSEMILGVEFNGDARAYSIPLLSSHEIVNDTVGGVAISVTW